MKLIPVLLFIMTNTKIIVLHRSHGTKVVLQAYEDALGMRRASVTAQYIGDIGWKKNKEHVIISGLVGGCLLSLNLDWRDLIGIRVAAILKNAFRYISREPSSLRLLYDKRCWDLFYTLFNFPYFLWRTFFCNINIFNVIIFTKLSFRISP